MKKNSVKKMAAVSAIALLGLTSLYSLASPGDRDGHNRKDKGYGMERYYDDDDDGYKNRGHMQGKRADALKADLKLTAEQEKNWTTFESEMQKADDIRRNISAAAWDKMTFPERSAKRRDIMTAKDKAVLNFYNTLTAEQKKVFDARH